MQMSDTKELEMNQVKAEDAVVAIILSGIVGNIIDTWELVSVEENSKIIDGQSIQRSEEIFIDDANKVVETLDIHENDAKSELSKSRISNKTDSSKISFTATGHSTFNQGTDNNKERNPSTLDDRETEHETQFNFVLRSLLKRENENKFNWTFLEENQFVSIIFKQGNKYEGSLSRCRMHGKGKFTWSDGSVYEGTFLNGEITGKGRMQWPDQSWYEGEFVRGLRSGVGLFVQNPTFYIGDWKDGLRDGLGTIYYTNNTSNSYYNGEWSGDRKHGTGLRCYKSGAMYSGEWSHGKRHGLGTMVWNYDVYSGHWNEGEIHGYGEYTWDTFFNQQLVVPKENCYYGEWVTGVRHGNGTLETSRGGVIRGTWSNGKKHGPAQVICCNGELIFAENLFYNDNISFKHESLSETDSLMDSSFNTNELYRVVINQPSHNIDLTYYIDKLNSYILTRETTFVKSTSINDTLNTNTKFCSIFENKKTFNNQGSAETISEENSLRNVILQNLSSLKMVYENYSKLCCQSKVEFSAVMMRIMFWQLLRDCNLNNRGISLAHYDDIIANNKKTLVQSIHYPFERLQFWQFLHCLIEMSWELYGKNTSGTPNIPGTLASAFHRLFTTDILPNAGKHKGNALFKYKNLLSLEAVYWMYKRIGEPLSARQLLKEIMGGLSPDEKDKEKGSTKVVFEYPEHLLRGKNVIGVGGKLSYQTTKELLWPKMKQFIESDLTCFRSIGLLNVLDCIKEVCPSIHVNDSIVNMDYEIIFLEFYEVLLLCAEKYIQMNSPKDIIVDMSRENSYEEVNIKTSVNQDREISTSKPKSNRDKSKKQQKLKKTKQEKKD